MGLDQYLNKAPRYKGATMKDICAIESYFDWKKAKERGSEYANCTLEKWCGVKWKGMPHKDYRDFYKQFYKERYYVWDTNHEYPRTKIIQEVGYWRKANAIHQWFVDNVQSGIDDCDYHEEITQKVLLKLLMTCERVYENSKLVSGKVVSGFTFENGEYKPKYEDGLVIEDSSTAERLLPTQSGFFFGGTNYDEWYLKDIEYTMHTHVI